MSKRILAMLLALVLVASLAGCGSKGNKIDNTKPEKNNTSQSEKETNKKDKDKQEESKKEEPNNEENSDSSSEMPKELKEAVESVINSAANEEDITDKVINFANDEVNKAKYYDSDLLNKALAKSDTFSILVKSDEVKVKEASKISKTEWKVTLTNELGDNKDLQFIKVDDNWLLNINSITTVGKLDIVNNVKVTINGLEVPIDYIESKAASTMYNIPGLLVGVTNTLEHETGFTETFKTEFIASAEKAVKLRYELTETEFETMLPELETMFNNMYAATLEGDAVKIAGYLADNTKVDANAIKDGLSNVDMEGYKLTNLEKRSDKDAQGVNVCYMSAKDEYTLNLKAKMSITGGTFAGRAPTKYNWITVAKTADGLKIVDCSSELWMSEVNPFSTDK